MRILPAPVLDETGRAYRRAIWGIVTAIALLATVQVAWALMIGSQQHLKDGLDWSYDVALYGLAAVVFGRGPRLEQVSAFLVAVILAVAGLHTLYDLWDKIVSPRPIDIGLLGFSAGSAILVGYGVVLTLWRFRGEDNPLIKATWLSARNDAIATTLYASLTFVVRTAPVRWPEYALDVFGAALCFQATYAILRSIARDRRSDEPAPAVR